MALASSNSSALVCQERVVRVEPRQDLAICVLANQSKLLVPRLLAQYIAIGDEITFPIPSGEASGTEIYVAKNSTSRTSHCLYQAPIAYVSQPKQDKRNQHFVAAEVRRGSLGIGTIFLPCETLREYFYRLSGPTGKADRLTLYDVLRVPAGASPSELRVAFKLRDLELRYRCVNRSESGAGAGIQHRWPAGTARLLWRVAERSRISGPISIRRIWLTSGFRPAFP